MSDIFKYFSLEGFNLRVANQPFIFSQVSTQWTPRGMIKANHIVKQNKLHPQVPSPPSPRRNPNESPPLCPCGIYLGRRSCRGLVPMMFRQLWSVTVGVRVWEAVLPYMAGWGSTSGPTLFSSLQIVLLWVSRGGEGQAGAWFLAAPAGLQRKMNAWRKREHLFPRWWIQTAWKLNWN